MNFWLNIQWSLRWNLWSVELLKESPAEFLEVSLKEFHERSLKQFWEKSPKELRKESQEEFRKQYLETGLEKCAGWYSKIGEISGARIFH